MIINDFNGEYRFLSNFYQSDFEYKGLTYHNAEAAFQAQKCASEEAKIKYTEVKNPVVAKRMGKKERDATLIEGNHWHDNRWGDCTCERCSAKEGQNWLGKILMEIRDSAS